MASEKYTSECTVRVAALRNEVEECLEESHELDKFGMDESKTVDWRIRYARLTMRLNGLTGGNIWE